MTWALAATYGARGPADPGQVLEQEAPGGTHRVELAELVVAASTAPVAPADGRSLCAIAGAIYDAEGPARAAGLDPALPIPELLARAHARIGAAVLDGLRGDFCLLLYDPDADEGLVARDHMGGLPVYWQRQGGAVTIATDPRLALRMAPQRPAPDLASLAHWISPSGVAAGRTLYAGLQRLAAGHLLRLRGRSATAPERYWTPRYGARRKGSRAELVGGLRERLQTAIARRTPPAGGAVLLSGGLDSSTVAAFAAGRTPTRIASGYSAVFPDHPTVDETAQIDTLCDTFGLRGVRAEVRSGSVLEGALAYLERFELPPVSPNLFFWIPLFERAAEDGVGVLLDGEGGDELFGLSPHLIADRLRRGRILAARRLIDDLPGARGAASKHVVRQFMREYGLRGAMPAWVQRTSRRLHGPDRYTEPYLLPAGKRAYMGELDELSWKRIAGPRWWGYLVDITTRGLGTAFVYEHSALRARMAGIQPRHPLVDADLVEYVLALPPELAWDPDRSRPLVRETTAGVLPDEIRLRPDKSSFDAVFHAGLAGPDLPVLRTLLSPRDARLREYVDLEIVRRELLDPGPPGGTRPLQAWAIKLWRLATAELWLRHQEDPAEPRKVLENARLPVAEVRLTSRDPVKSPANA
jgi:asparagine synthase (glutamine-hydrolysing)